ncbi:MAG: glycine cleavage system protein H [Betaproteobacteria bacterium]|nr:glycine cleavage system protein H [Betaproteobacteria bacterium]MDE2003977.1 glycine cleavage system protein H [Betaproteobacteria bacterium]MDE2209008.1 glycine cleavage system protein H [Betaproteobacteria bacterium]MDE2359110.1 glycine cleavage system protein H [Betaproteobacteria bacterium]
MAEYSGCELPEDLWYDLDYLWARPGDDGTFTLGMTDPAQTMAGRVVAATFRKVGTYRKAGRSVATLESGKWVGGVPAPFDATIERINPAVEADPGLVNVAPYTDAWLVVLRPENLQDAYARLTRGPEAIEALKAWIDKYRLQCMRCTS